MTTRRLSSHLFSALLAFGALVSSTTACSSDKTTQATSSGGTSSGDVGARRESVPCKSGETTLPIEAFDINTDDLSQGSVCEFANVLDDDGKAAVLSYTGPTPHTLAGRDVGGCFAAEFSDGVTLSSLTMKMRSIGNGCGGAACTQGGDEGCGTGWKVSIFVGPSLSKLEWLQQLSLTQADYFDYRVVVYDRFKAKFIAVCREPTAATGDSIAIDAVSGFCD